jgi:hypothetical protein
MVALVWDAAWRDKGELAIHSNFFSIDAKAQKELISAWKTDLDKLEFQIRPNQPITELALPRLKRLFFGSRGNV